MSKDSTLTFARHPGAPYLETLLNFNLLACLES